MSRAAQRKHEQRERMRAKGYTAVEVWIPARHRATLRRLEELLRRDIVPAIDHPYHHTPRGERIMDSNLLAHTLEGMRTEGGLRLGAAIDDDTVQVSVGDREEFPISVTAGENQIICLTHLFGAEEVKDGQEAQMAQTMLVLNVMLPLSAFGRVGNAYVLFGAIGANASIEEIGKEIDALSDNTLEAMEALTEYLD